MKNKIDYLLAKIGFWLISRNTLVTTTSHMILENTKKLRCEHCGLNPIHYLENCDCSKALESDNKVIR